MAVPAHASPLERIWYYMFRFICGLIFLFLIFPIIVIVPLSFNVEPYFSFSEGMLSFDPAAFSTRWYSQILRFGSADESQPMSWALWSDAWANAKWVNAAKNSFIIGIAATILATGLGTLAALGLSRPQMPFRNLIMGLLISPIIVPLIISAAAMYFFYSTAGGYLEFLGPGKSYLPMILGHTALGIPFVIITVTATMVSFDHSLTRAAANLGANPRTVFFKVIMPLILPGMISGALFAFITSFDEVVVALFLSGIEQRTIPRQMYSGLREEISPTILAVATILVIISILLLTTIELLRRRSEKMRGLSPG